MACGYLADSTFKPSAAWSREALSMTGIANRQLGNLTSIAS